MSEEDIELLRFFFVLPEPVALPDGFYFSAPVGDGQLKDWSSDDPVVGITVLQEVVPGGRIPSTLDALTEATKRASLLPEPRDERSSPTEEFSVQHTVIDAVTVKKSPDPIPTKDIDNPQRWSPRSDALTRCIALTDQMLRTHRLATEATHGSLAYVRVSSTVLAYEAQGVKQTLVVGGKTLVRTVVSGEWSGGSLILLDHTNLADPFMGRGWDQSVNERFDYFLREQERGNPLTLWRERHVEAKRALNVTGELTGAVLLMNTSSEVLLDTVLALVMWEEGSSIEDAAPIFEQGKALRRLTGDLPRRLGGTWATDNGAVGDWYIKTYRLRHRIIHGGYNPGAREAWDAFEAAAGLQRFVWDRLAEKRTVYPRSALMTIAQEGLEKRGLWSGKIRKFAEDVAPTEPNWRNSYAQYYRDLMDAQVRQERS